jgi:hypothetical protein
VLKVTLPCVRLFNYGNRGQDLRVEEVQVCEPEKLAKLLGLRASYAAICEAKIRKKLNEEVAKRAKPSLHINTNFATEDDPSLKEESDSRLEVQGQTISEGTMLTTAPSLSAGDTRTDLAEATQSISGISTQEDMIAGKQSILGAPQVGAIGKKDAVRFADESTLTSTESTCRKSHLLGRSTYGEDHALRARRSFYSRKSVHNPNHSFTPASQSKNPELCFLSHVGTDCVIM